MNDKGALRLFAATIFEIRTLLSRYIGANNEQDVDVRLAAHLAYALHNEALAVLEENEQLDLNVARSKIRQAQELIGATYHDSFNIIQQN